MHGADAAPEHGVQDVFVPAQREERPEAVAPLAGLLADFDGVFGSFPVGMSLLGPGGRLMRVNPAACGTVGPRLSRAARERLVRTAPVQVPGETVAVGTLEELLRLADTYDRMVLLWDADDVTTYLVQDDGFAYRCDVRRQPDAVTGSHGCDADVPAPRGSAHDEREEEAACPHVGA